MKSPDITKKISTAEKRIAELTKEGAIKSLPDRDNQNISNFFEAKSKNRLQTARIILKSSKELNNYSDYADAEQAIRTAEEFINTIRQVMVK